MENFNLYRQDRQGPHITKTKGGGLLTYVNETYQVDSNIYAHLNRCNQDLEAQVLEIRKVNRKRVVVTNLYRPPSGNQKNFLNQISDILLGLKNLRYHDIYFLGDLNLDHTQGMANDLTKDLIALFQTYGLDQVIKGTTRKTRTTATIIDVIYVKTNKKIHPLIHPTSLSDHYLVSVVTYLGYKAPPKVVIKGRSYKKYSLELAREFYDLQRRDLIYQYNDVDLIWSTLYKYIFNCAQKLCPIREMKINLDKPTWVTSEIIEMVKRKDKALADAYASGAPEDLAHAKALRTDTKRSIRNARADFIRRNLENTASDPN